MAATPVSGLVHAYKFAPPPCLLTSRLLLQATMNVQRQCEKCLPLPLIATLATIINEFRMISYLANRSRH